MKIKMYKTKWGMVNQAMKEELEKQERLEIISIALCGIFLAYKLIKIKKIGRA